MSNQNKRCARGSHGRIWVAPDFPIARWFLMLSLVADGQRDEAKEALRKAFELGYRFRSPDEESVARDLLGASEFEAFRKAYTK